MIKTISYWSFEGGLENTRPIQEVLDQAHAAGFEALELCIAPTGVLTTDSTEADCRSIRELVDASGLRLETLASGMSWAYNPASNDPDVRATALDLHGAALQRAAWLGVTGLLYVPGVVMSPICPDENVRYDLAVERARAAISQLLKIAERVKVDLLIENVWNGMFYSPMELADFVDWFDSDRLGIYFDAGNVLGYHQDPAHWIEILAHRIRRVHVKDFDKSVGTLDGFCDLFDGDVPFPRVVSALRAIGYDKTVVAEMIPWNEGLVERTSTAMDRILSGAGSPA